MSSLAVRTEITDWLNANYSATPWFDMSYFQDMEDISPDSRSKFMLVQFVSGGEAVASTGPGLCWEEDGIIQFHVCGPVGGSTMDLLAISTDLALALKGKRLGNTVIEAVSPPNDADGAGIQWDGNWHGFTSVANYMARSFTP